MINFINGSELYSFPDSTVFIISGPLTEIVKKYMQAHLLSILLNQVTSVRIKVSKSLSSRRVYMQRYKWLNKATSD